MFRVLGIYNFGLESKSNKDFLLFCRILHAAGEIAIHCGNARTIRGCGPGEGQCRGKGQPHKGHPPGRFRPILGRKYSVKGRVCYEINNTYRDKQTATKGPFFQKIRWGSKNKLEFLKFQFFVLVLQLIFRLTPLTWVAKKGGKFNLFEPVNNTNLFLKISDLCLFLLHIVKLLAVDRFTIQFCKLLAKGSSTYTLDFAGKIIDPAYSPIPRLYKTTEFFEK